MSPNKKDLLANRIKRNKPTPEEIIMAGDNVNKERIHDMETNDVDVKHKQDTETNDVKGIQNNDTDNAGVDSNGTHDTSNIAEYIRQYEKQVKEKKRMEDEYSRQTYLIRNDLIKRLDKIVKRKPRGAKTQIINKILEDALDILEREK